MTAANLFEQTYRIHLRYRVLRDERFPISPNDVVRRWLPLPGVISVGDTTCYHYDAKYVELHSVVTVEFASQAYMLQALARRH